MNPSAATRTTWHNPVDVRLVRVDAETAARDNGALTDDVLLQVCGLAANDPQVTPEWLSRMRLVRQFLVEPRLCQHARLEAAMTLLASALGQLTQFNPTHLPFGYEGPEMQSPDWMERRALERVGKQIVGLMWCDRPPESIAIAVETAVSEAVRVGFIEQQRYDAWRPGMPSGSGWRSVVRVTPYGLARARLPMPADPRPPRTPEPLVMQTKELRSDGLDINEVARAVREFRRAMWEYQDSRDWVDRLTDEAAAVGDDRDRRERLAVRDACGDRNANARQRVVETFPIIMRQAEHLGLDTTSLRDAIVRSPTSAEVLRDVGELVDRIEGHLKLNESVDKEAAITRTRHVGAGSTAPRAIDAEAAGESGESSATAPDDRYEWARQIDLVRATNQVLGDGMLNKGVLSRACADGQVENNGKTGRGARVRVRSFLTWVSRQHQLGAEETNQIRNAVIGEISSRNS